MRLVPFAALAGCPVVGGLNHIGVGDCIWVNYSTATWDCADVEYCEDARGDGMFFDRSMWSYNCDDDVDACDRMACRTCDMPEDDYDFYCR